MKKIFFIGILLFCLYNSKNLFAQEIRVEGFVGTEAPSIDIFWLRPFAKGSQFLYLSRNTFTVPDYENETGNFNTLHIVAYQIKKTGLGVAIAATATSNAPLQARGGIQYLKVKPKSWLLYSIVSSKLGSNPDLRWLTIAQFTPKISEKVDLFTRAEWVSSIGFSDRHRFSSGILRLGLQMNKWQFGPGVNFLWIGGDFTNQTTNYGIFLTHLF